MIGSNDAKVVIAADDSQVHAAFGRIAGAMPGLSAAIAGGFSIAAITAFVKSSIDAADELNDLSQKTGIAVETLAGFKLVAEQNGTTIEGVATGVKKLSTYMVEHGDKLRKAGIDAKTADGALLQLSDVFSKMTDPVQRSALATELFGKAGTDLIPMLMQGSTALGEMIDKGKALNPITTEMAKQADAFNDSMAELKAASAGAGTALANSLLPALNSVISRLNEGIQATGSLMGGINALAMGAYSDKYIKDRINDYDNGDNAYASTPEQIEQLKREEKRRRDEISARVVASYGAIDSREGRGRSTDGASISSANAAAAGLLSGKGAKAGKSPKERSGFQMSAEESALLDEWSSGSIKQDMDDALTALADRDAQIAAFVTQKRESRVAAIEAEQMTERDREQLAFAERMAFLQSAREQELAEAEQHGLNQMDVHARYAALMEETTIQHQAKLGNVTAQAALSRRKFDEMTLVQQASSVAGLLTSHLGAVANKNKAFFYAHKLGSIAQATISTYEGATKALAMGPLIGPPLAAMIVAAGLANVAQIKAQRFEGGGGGASLPSYSAGQAGQDFLGSTQSGPPVPVMQAQAATPTTERRVVLLGDFAEAMVDTLRPILEDGWINGAGNMRLVLERSQ
jgi:hypothetical protein